MRQSVPSNSAAGGRPIVDRPFEQLKFLKGADVSSIPEKEEKCLIFRDADGKAKDPLDLIAGYGINSIRLRIWNELQICRNRVDIAILHIQ